MAHRIHTPFLRLSIREIQRHIIGLVEPSVSTVTVSLSHKPHVGTERKGSESTLHALPLMNNELNLRQLIHPGTTGVRSGPYC